MASTASATTWLRGKVKAVPSGDSLVIIGSSKGDIPPERTITLSSLIAPKLARRGTSDEPFAWHSREFLRKLCIGKDVAFRVEYTVPSIGREFGSVFIGDRNVAVLVVSEGWAKVRVQGQQKGEVSPFLAELLRLEEQAKNQGLGIWSKVSAEAAIRYLPPSAIGDAGNMDAAGYLKSKKGKPMEAIVEQVRDGSTLRAYLLPDFQFVQLFVAGTQAPSMGRRAASEAAVDAAAAPMSGETNGDTSGEVHAPITSAQRLAASPASVTEVAPDPFGREAKHFTEMRVLHRDVKIILVGTDKYSNFIGSVHFREGDSELDLGLELIQNGLAKYVDWSARLLQDEARRRLKNSELQAKTIRLRIWTNYVPPQSDSKTIINEKFTGEVIEVVGGDCVVVADDSLPYGHPNAERRVHLSSIRGPKMGNRQKEEKPSPHLRDVNEFLRNRLIGRQVHVCMEYSRKVPVFEGSKDKPKAAGSQANKEERIMRFGTVFLLDEGQQANAAAGSHQPGVNIAELLVTRGYASVVRHRDFEERSSCYETLISAENRALDKKKGLHANKETKAVHIKDLLTVNAKKARDSFPFLQRSGKMLATVEYIFSGHRFKLFIPKETCILAFSFSGVRCAGREEPYSAEAISLMRRMLMQKEVEIQIDSVDRTGTFLGSMWKSKKNVASTLLEAGLATLQTSFDADRLPDFHLLTQAEQSAKRQKLKIWEKDVEGKEVTNGPASETKKKEERKVIVTEVLGGGKFYVQPVGDIKVASIQKQLAALNLQEAPLIGAFNPKKGSTILAQFSGDNTWNRAMIVNVPRGGAQSPDDKFEVFYIDYGNQEIVPYSRLRPLDSSIPSTPGFAQLCSLAYLKVPGLEQDYGQEAGLFLSNNTLGKEFTAVIEEKESLPGKSKGQGGATHAVMLIDAETGRSINATMLQEGLARLEKRRRWESKNRQQAMEELEVYQKEARDSRIGMWEYGDAQSDDEDSAPPPRRAAGKR